MTSVFIGGSIAIGQVDAELAMRLENIIAGPIRVLIGDANGFDRAAQAYLAQRHYAQVTVYCTRGECRNNVGQWPTQVVAYAGRDHWRAFYTAKDDAMVKDADYGLFAWDQKSKGTLRNIRRMAELGKRSVVYMAPHHHFATVREVADLATMTAGVEMQPLPAGDLFGRV